MHPAAGEVRASPCLKLFNFVIQNRSYSIFMNLKCLRYPHHPLQTIERFAHRLGHSFTGFTFVSAVCWKALQSPRLKQWHTLRSQPCDTGKAQNIEHWHNTRCKPNSQHDTHCFHWTFLQRCTAAKAHTTSSAEWIRTWI